MVYLVLVDEAHDGKHGHGANALLVDVTKLDADTLRRLFGGDPVGTPIVEASTNNWELYNDTLAGFIRLPWTGTVAGSITIYIS